jgi:hypothetical protein
MCGKTNPFTICDQDADEEVTGTVCDFPDDDNPN